MKRLRITVEGKTYDVEVEMLDEGQPAHAPRTTSSGSARVSTPVSAPRAAPTPAAAGGGEVASPLSAVVVSIDVAVGDSVTKGQKVVTLEAMKMNTIVSAHVAGTVNAINVSVGDAVQEGQSLITIA